MSPNPQGSSRIKALVILVLVVLMTSGLGLTWAYFRSQQVPEFYQRAEARVAERNAQQTPQPQSSVESPSTGSEQKLNNLLAALTGTGAHNAEADEWLAALGETSTTHLHEILGEDDVNAWLEKELPRKFQQCLPPGVSEPHVQFSNGTGLVGFRYQRGGLEGVVSLEVDVSMTGRNSQLGIRIRRISVGSLPLPVAQVLDLISDAGHRSQGPGYRGPEVVRWTQQGGDPMALLQASGLGGGYFNSLESFSLRNGEVEVVIKRQPNLRR